MGLNDLVPDDAGQAKGGRPEEKPSERKRAGPTQEQIESEEWWQDMWDDVVSGEEPTPDEMGEMCDRVFMFPWDVKARLESFSIHEFDWEEMDGDYPSAFALAANLEREGVNNDFVQKVREIPKTKKPPWAPGGSGKTKTGGGKFGDGTTGDEGGLLGLVSDAKK